MNDITTTVNNYIAVWNETVPEERRARIADTFADGATYLDPLQAGERSRGHRRDGRRCPEAVPGDALRAVRGPRRPPRRGALRLAPGHRRRGRAGRRRRRLRDGRRRRPPARGDRLPGAGGLVRRLDLRLSTGGLGLPVVGGVLVEVPAGQELLARLVARLVERVDARGGDVEL